jgi:iron complex transport system substrate-binding protein
MRRTLILAALIVACFAASFLAKMTLRQKSAVPVQPTTASAPAENAGTSYNRIVSLAPSITEDLYALGLIDRVVGVTRYCIYPPEARKKTNVGGYYDPNYEAIIALDPDLIIMLAEHEDPRKYLSGLGFNILVVDNRNIPGILQAIESIGSVCGVSEKAKSITDNLRERIKRIEEKTAGLPSPRVLISVGRNLGTGTLEDVYISGKEGFYDKMVTLLGGVNAYDGTVAFPVVSNEGIIRMNPDVIIDMVPDLKDRGWSAETVLKEWNVLSRVNAVRNHRVFVFGENYVVVPGPRFISIMERIARVMYPDANWE